MARDYTKFSVKGLAENLNKRQLVFEIVKDYVEKNKPSFDELTAIFKDEIQGSKGFIRKAAKVEDPKRFNTKIPLKIKFGVDVVVSNQWGSKNLDAFLSLAKKLKYKITFVEKQSSNSDDFTPSSNLTTEQITEFKEQEAEINGDYEENAWEASSLYDDLIEAGDTAWADSVLQKMEDAANDFSDLKTVFEKLKERNETERFLVVIKKSEEKADATREYTQLAEEVKEIDKDWAVKLYQKAEKVSADYSDLTSVAAEVLEMDKDWAIKIYKNAEKLADNSFNHRDLAETIYSLDKDWALNLIAKAEEKAKDFNDFSNLGDTYGNSDLFNDKAKAKAMFEKAFPLIESKWDKNNLLNSAKDILGNSDSFTQKMVEFIENDIPKMKLPKQYFPDYNLACGKIITLNLANGPSCHKIDHFNIKLNMETNEVIGHADCDDHLSRWFDSWEVGIYDGYSEHRSYDGEIRIWGKDDNENEWCVYCHGGFEELEEGELPDGVTGEDIWNALGNGKAIYELYHHIKQNISDAAKISDESTSEETNVGSSSDVSNGEKSYVYIKVYDDNTGNDLKLIQSTIVKSNGKYTLSFDLDSDGDGVIDQYRFNDIKTKVYASNGSPWDFEEFTDEEGQWIEKYESFEDFGYDSDEISETLYNMRLEFVEKYLNEASQENMLYEAAVPKDKREMLKEEVKHDGVDYFTGNLVFEEGDKSIVPEEF